MNESKNERTKYDDRVYIRVDSQTKKALIGQAKVRKMKVSELIRELISIEIQGLEQIKFK